jgi:hypothetical protein
VKSGLPASARTPGSRAETATCEPRRPCFPTPQSQPARRGTEPETASPGAPSPSARWRSAALNHLAR